MSLNPNAKLYKTRSLLEFFDRSRPRDRACLEAFKRELDMPWALYHVRRLFLLSSDGSGKHRPVLRSTERVDLGRPHQLAHRLAAKAERFRFDVEIDPLYGRARTWVRPRAQGWPMAEEFFVTAPAHVINKQDPNFEQEWQAHLFGAATQLPFT
ncbi:hypothetical protein [Streptomyces formicae]